MQEFRATSATHQSAARPSISAYFFEESEIKQGSSDDSSWHLGSFDPSFPRSKQSAQNLTFDQSCTLSGVFAQTKSIQAEKRLEKTQEKRDARINKLLPKYQRSSFERISPLNIQPRSMEAYMLVRLAKKADRSERESWVEIGRQHGGRPVYQVIRSWLALQLPNQLSSDKRRWLPEEELLLDELVSICGGISKSVVQEQQFPGRLQSQLYFKWRKRRQENKTCIAPSTQTKTTKPLLDSQPKKVVELAKRSTPEPKRSSQASVCNLEPSLAQIAPDSQFQPCLKVEHSNFDSILRKENPVNEVGPITALNEVSFFHEFDSYPSKTNMTAKQQVTADAAYNDLGNSFDFDDIRPEVSDTYEMKQAVSPTLTRDGTEQILATAKLPQSSDLSERRLLCDTEDSFDIQAKIQEDFQCLDELVDFPVLFDRINDADCTQYENNEETFIAITQGETGRSDRVYCLPDLHAALLGQL